MEKKKSCFNLLVCLLIVLCVVFTGASLGTYGTTKMASSYYQVEEWENGNYDAVIFELTFNKDKNDEIVKTKSIWAKLGGYDYSNISKNIEISVLSSTSEKTSYTTSYGGGNKSKAQTYANFSTYIKLADITSTSTSRKYYEFVFKNIMKIEEIVFLDDNNDKITAEVKYAGPTASTSGNPTATIFSEEYSYRIKQAKKLIDEQSTFVSSKIENDLYKMDKIKTLSEREMVTLESVRNIISGKGRFVDSKVNPLGLEIISLGVLIFGGNTFGLRIIPLIFSIATIILMFYMGKLLFGKESMGLLTAFIYAIGGFALSGAVSGTVISIFVFFTVASFLGMFRFYRYGISSKNKLRSLLPLILSGVMFAFSLATKMEALFSLVALLILFVLTLYRTVKVNNYRNSKLSEADIEKRQTNNYILRRKIALSLSVFLGAFILFGAMWLVLSFLFALGAYKGAYSDKNFSQFVSYIFEAIGRKNAIGYTNVNTNIMGFLLNLQAEKISTVKFFTGNLVIAILSLFSFIYSTSYVLSVVTSKSEEKHSKEFKKEILTPYILLGLAFLVNFVFIFVGGYKGISEFSVGSVFYYAMIALCFSIINKSDKKVLFKIGKFEVNVTKIVFALIIAFAFVVLCFSYPKIIGIPVDKYYFNILSIKW